MHEGTPIKSHIAEFFSNINDLDKIEVKIKDEDQALLLLCFLHSSYKSFREATSMEASQRSMSMRSRSIFSSRTKLTPSWRVSLIMIISGSSLFKGEENNGSSTGNSKHKNLTCNYCHKKGHIKSECWLRKKKNQMLILLNWLKEMKNNTTFYLLQIN